MLLRPHDPLVQTAGKTQSAFEAHPPLQALLPQRNGKHESAAGVTQVPAPSQVDAAVKVVVSLGQLGLLQTVPLT